ADPYRSARLIYRAVDNPGDLDLFKRLGRDGNSYLSATPMNAIIPGTKQAMGSMEKLENATIGVIICLPREAEDSSTGKTDPELIPIGQVHLGAQHPGMIHHRRAWLGISLLPEYQGKGYGSEAIYWITDWAFRRTGLHKVQIGTFEYNEGAVRLYEKVGYKLEGRIKEQWFQHGRWWDEFLFGMIDREWEEVKRKREQE
ncbi:acyl-CoA N-acyltransferase, partial [Elsinoe ampelina]